jgi:hypothetical protein
MTCRTNSVIRAKNPRLGSSLLAGLPLELLAAVSVTFNLINLCGFPAGPRRSGADYS